MRYFNTEGICRPEEHYMVRLDEKLEEIKRLYVDRGKYFVINRGDSMAKLRRFLRWKLILGRNTMFFS